SSHESSGAFNPSSLRPRTRQDRESRTLQRSQLLDNLLLAREAAGIMLGKNSLPVHGDIKDAAASAHDMAVDADRFLDLRRQTGGTGKVVSDSAVIDSNVHGSDRLH